MGEILVGSLAFRDALVQRLVEWSYGRQDFRLYMENGANVDLDKDTRPVVAVEIHYNTSLQADLHEQPLQRDDGTVLVTVLVKELSGMRVAYQLRDEVAKLLQRQEFGGARLMVGERLPNSDALKGWVGYRIAFPFQHYYLSE